MRGRGHYQAIDAEGADAVVVAVMHACVREGAEGAAFSIWVVGRAGGSCGALAHACVQVTRERVRQIETKALRKLKARQQLLAGKLHEYSSGMELMEEHSYAARTSSGTKKT